MPSPKSKLTANGKTIGRPCTITAEIQAKIIFHLSQGGTVKSFCKTHRHVVYGTVFNFMLTEAGQSFREEVSRAREIGMHAMAEECLTIIDDKNEDTMRARNRVELRMKLAAAWNRKAFGAKQDIDVTSRVTLGELVEAAIKHTQQTQPMLDITPPAALPGAQMPIVAPQERRPDASALVEVPAQQSETRRPRRVASAE